MKKMNKEQEMDFYEELMSNAKNDDAGSRLRAASMIMEKCGDMEVAETLRTLSAQMDFDDNEEASAAIERTRSKLDSLIEDRRSHDSQSYIRMLRDEEILELSNGEVTENDFEFLTSAFCKNGLFDPDIFGGSGKIPFYDDENGRYDTKTFGRGFGHIQCPVRVVLKEDYSTIAALLHMTAKDVEKVAKYACYLVLDPGKSSCKKLDVLTERDYQEYLENELNSGLEVGMGGNVFYSALKELGYGDHPERLAFSVIPVISPVVRPVAYSKAYDTFYSFHLNNEYNAVVTRSNRSRVSTEKEFPEIILRNEYRMLDDAVNRLVELSRNIVRNTHWSKSGFYTFMYSQMSLLQRKRNFSIYRFAEEEITKTSEIKSLNLFPVTITLCDDSGSESKINLTSVIDHNENVVEDFRQENFMVYSADDMDYVQDVDATDGGEMKRIDDALNRMESYGKAIISEARLKREACKVRLDKQEDLYMLVGA